MFYVSNEINVKNLGSTVGEHDPVFSGGLVAVPHFRVREVVPAVIVANGIPEGVVGWSLETKRKSIL